MKFGGAGHDGPGTGFSLRSTGGLSGVRSTDERFEVAKILYMPDCVPAYGGNFRNPQDRIASPDCKENGARESCGPMPAVRKSLRTVWVRTDRKLSVHAVPVSFPFVRGRFEAGFSGRFEIGGVRAHSRCESPPLRSAKGGTRVRGGRRGWRRLPIPGAQFPKTVRARSSILLTYTMPIPPGGEGRFLRR